VFTFANNKNAIRQFRLIQHVIQCLVFLKSYPPIKILFLSLKWKKSRYFKFILKFCTLANYVPLLHCSSKLFPLNPLSFHKLFLMHSVSWWKFCLQMYHPVQPQHWRCGPESKMQHIMLFCEIIMCEKFTNCT
jgi:hypothetical protein